MPIIHTKRKLIPALLCLALGALGSIGSLGAQAGDRGKDGRDDGRKLLVAVLEPSGNAGVTAMHKKSARGGMEEYISGSEKYRALDRSRFDDILSKKQRQAGGLPDKKIVKKLRKKAGADFVCALDLYREGDYFNATCWLIDAKTGETATANDFVKKDTPVEMAFVIGTLAGRLLGEDGQGQRLAQAREARDTENRASEAVEAAKKTIERLAPGFSVEKRGGADIYTNRALTQYAEQQRGAVLAKKQAEAHALTAEISQGRLVAASKYAYRGQDNKLDHTKLSVTVDGRKASTPLMPTRTIEGSGGTGGTGAVGMGIEEAELADADVLRLIADNPSGQAKIQIENREGFFKTFFLSPAAAKAIAQTIEMTDALEAIAKKD